MYSTEDYEILRLVTDQFYRWITTPNILTEISNLSGQPIYLKIDYFRALPGQLKNGFEEHYVPSDVLFHHPAFVWVGLTDASILSLALQEDYLVLTDDFRLHILLAQNNLPVINFTHFRNYLQS